VDLKGVGGSPRAQPSVTESPGSVTAYIPDIDGLLPVYVRDGYEGFEVKLFSELTDAELDRYLDANVSAVAEVAELTGGVDAALANHLVMGPAILARAGLTDGFAVKIHGSALEYTVRPHPRFLPHAREGLAAANGVLVGSRHTAESLWSTLAEPSLPVKTRLGPPGVDVELFAPRVVDPGLRLPRSAASAWGRDDEATQDAVTWWLRGSGPRLLYVGKLIVSKGVDLLLAAWPLVHATSPEARLLIAGFGEYRDGLERLWSALERGDIADVIEIAALGRGLEGGPEGELRLLRSFLDHAPQGYEAAARAASGSVRFAGRLEHEEVAAIAPAADATIVPSTFPESFGMVAAEAAAAGALPICADHSGLREVARELAARLPGDVGRLLSFPLEDGASGIAERLNAWLAIPEARREEMGRVLAATVRELWSWEGVARGVIAASRGRLDDLPRVPEGTGPEISAAEAGTDG
jgi:glycosyltransferase involved in cell wall biosynthesis